MCRPTRVSPWADAFGDVIQALAWWIQLVLAFVGLDPPRWHRKLSRVGVNSRSAGALIGTWPIEGAWRRVTRLVGRWRLVVPRSRQLLVIWPYWFSRWFMLLISQLMLMVVREKHCTMSNKPGWKVQANMTSWSWVWAQRRIPWRTGWNWLNV
jgi:hypothetical protein